MEDIKWETKIFKRRTYFTISELNLSLLKYIEGFYNSIHLHSHNDGLSPNEHERLFFVY